MVRRAGQGLLPDLGCFNMPALKKYHVKGSSFISNCSNCVHVSETINSDTNCNM